MMGYLREVSSSFRVTDFCAAWMKYGILISEVRPVPIVRSSVSQSPPPQTRGVTSYGETSEKMQMMDDREHVHIVGQLTVHVTHGDATACGLRLDDHEWCWCPGRVGNPATRWRQLGFEMCHSCRRTLLDELAQMWWSVGVR